MTRAKPIGRAAAASAETNITDRQELAARLREAREYLRLSQEEVARALEVPRSAISLMEAGQRKVDSIELKRLADIYQRSITFFTGEAGKSASMQETAKHLARAAAKLTDRDREELLAFAQFLQARGR